MPKVPYRPDPRPPRRKPILPPVDKCNKCLGTGELCLTYQNGEKEAFPCDRCGGSGEVAIAAPVCSACEGRRFEFSPTGAEVHCWVCKGTGKPLPPPPSGNPNTFGPPPWTGDSADKPTAQDLRLRCVDTDCPDQAGGQHRHVVTPRGSSDVMWFN